MILADQGGIPIEQIIGFDLKYIPGELFTSLLVILIIIILAIIVGIKARKADPLKKPKGILNVAEIIVDFADKKTYEFMGPKFPNFGSYIIGLVMFMILSFVISIAGLPNPFTYLGIPLSLGLITFFWIHFTSAKHKKWNYFRRYIEPLPPFLPINLLSMWSPLISISLRLFGNAFAGGCLTTLIYNLFAIVEEQTMKFSYAFVITPVLHIYFDVISGVIQTLIFTLLTMILVSQEVPESDDDILEKQLL